MISTLTTHSSLIRMIQRDQNIIAIIIHVKLHDESRVALGDAKLMDN